VRRIPSRATQAPPHLVLEQPRHLGFGFGFGFGFGLAGFEFGFGFGLASGSGPASAVGFGLVRAGLSTEGQGLDRVRLRILWCTKSGA